MLASNGVPGGQSLAEILAVDDPKALFQRIDGMRHWLGVVVRAMEWHSARLETLVLLVSADGAEREEKRAQQDRLLKFLDHYAKVCLKKPVEIKIRLFGHSCDPDQMFREVEAIQHSNRNLYAAEDVIFDFTGGTKPMSAEMVMSCLDDRFNLQYFPQLDRQPSSDFASVAKGWGKLPVEERYGLPGGVLPILIETDARSVRESLG